MSGSSLDDWLTAEEQDDYLNEVDHCPSCDEDVYDAWFDRELCAPPCDTMHYRCPKCGTALDGCRLLEDQ